MKWKMSYLYISLLLASFLLFGFFSCGTMRKTKTIIVTETLIKIDTVIKFVPDTITKIQYVRITDTAIIETPQAIARSYYSTTKQRIVLELNNKKFDVPVTIYKKVIATENKKEVVRSNNKWTFLIFGVLGGFIIFMLIKDRKEIFKNDKV